MESKGLKQHTIDSVISSIDSWYKKEAENYLNKVNFGIKNDEETDIKKYRFLKAFDNIICRNMTCDLKVTNELLEAVSVYTKTSTFKDLSIDYTLKKKEGKKPFNEIRSSKSGNNDNTPPFTKVLIYINEALKYEQFCGLELKFALVNSLGNAVSPTYDGTDIIIQDQRVSNSDDSYDVNIVSGVDLELPDITVSNSDDSYSVAYPSVQDVELPNITVSNSDDSYSANIPSVQDVELPDITVSNSDDSYSATYPSVQDVELPDVTISNSDASYSVTSPSVQNVSIPDEDITLNGGAFITKPSVKDQDIELVDTSDAPITPDSVVGNKIVVNTSAGCSAKGLLPLKSGQTTSYAAGDDGDLQRGRLVDYRTLPYNSGFGTTERFTDELGGQTFTNNIIIDWGTWDGGTNVNGYILSDNSDSNSGTNDWATWMSGQPYTTGGFGNWYVVNASEISTLINYNDASGINDYPFYNSVSNRLYTSTTAPSNTAHAIYKQRNTFDLSHVSKTSNNYSMWVRTFNWNGASLT